MAVGDLYKLRVDYALPEGPVSIGLGYRQKSGANGPATLQSAVDFFNANKLIALSNVLAVNTSIDQIRMDQVSTGNDIPGFVNIGFLLGNRMGNAIPAGGAAVVSWITDAPNSKNNGRVFIAGISESDIVSSVLTASILTALVAFVDEMLLDLLTSLPEDAVFELVTISRVLNGVPRVPPIGFKVESGLVRSIPFSQRRRITKRLGIS